MGLDVGVGQERGQQNPGLGVTCHLLRGLQGGTGQFERTACYSVGRWREVASRGTCGWSESWVPWAVPRTREVAAQQVGGREREAVAMSVSHGRGPRAQGGQAASKGSCHLHHQSKDRQTRSWSCSCRRSASPQFQ